MSSPEAYGPIHDYLEAQWTATDLSFENDGYRPRDTPAAFVLVEIFGTFFDQASIGAETVTANLWREAGGIYLHVCVPRGSGTLQARTYARQLSNLFRGQEIAGIRFRQMSIGAAGAGDEDGNYFRMTVTVDWERDE